MQQIFPKNFALNLSFIVHDKRSEKKLQLANTYDTNPPLLFLGLGPENADFRCMALRQTARQIWRALKQR